MERILERAEPNFTVIIRIHDEICLHDRSDDEINDTDRIELTKRKCNMGANSFANFVDGKIPSRTENFSGSCRIQAELVWNI